MLLRRTILSATLLGLFGVTAWGVWGYWHGGAEQFPLPNQPNGAPHAGPGKTPAPKPPVARAPTVPQPPAVPAVAAAPAQPSYLYIKYLPDEAESASSASGTSEGAVAPVAPSADLGSSHVFPAARLRVSGKADETVTAMLFSDDPKEAMDKNWTGDRYYFLIRFQQMTGFQRLEDRLDGAQWVYTAPETDREENGNGIFLRGGQLRLEPLYMQVQVEGQAPNLLVKMGGVFLQYDTTDPDAKPKRCQVQGVLVPRVEMKS